MLSYQDIDTLKKEPKMNFTQIISQVIILYAIMIIGAVIHKKGILSDAGISSISKLVIYVTLPAMIISGLADSTVVSKSELLDISIVSIIAYSFMVLMGFVVTWLLRVKKEERGFYRFITIFGNVGFIGYPILISIVGGHSVLLGSIFNIPFSLLFYTLGIYLMSRYSEDNINQKFEAKKLLSPGIIAAVLGLVLFILDIKLPKIVLDITKSLGGLTSPLAMLIVGASLNGIKFKEAVKNYKVLIISLIKMIIYPLLMALILRAIGISGTSAMIAVVLCGMPVGTNTVISANEFNKKNIEKASEAVVISTLLLIITVPILIWIVGLVQ
jgi:malate permease and related proteins